MAAAITVVLAIGLYITFTPTEAARVRRQVTEALEAGDLAAAGQHLDQLVTLAKDSVDQSSIMSLRMAVEIAQIIRDAQLIIEYQGLDRMLSGDDALGVEPGYTETIETLEARLREDQQRMLALAKMYHAIHYQSGLRLSSPLPGRLDLVQDEGAVLGAFRALVAGDATPDDHATFEASVAREATRAVLRLVIVQPESQSADHVALTGSLDLAELWWLIAANSTDADFSERALEIVIEETESQPEHPARERAQAALREVRRLG